MRRFVDVATVVLIPATVALIVASVWMMVVGDRLTGGILLGANVMTLVSLVLNKFDR